MMMSDLKVNYRTIAINVMNFKLEEETEPGRILKT